MGECICEALLHCSAMDKQDGIVHDLCRSDISNGKLQRARPLERIRACTALTLSACNDAALLVSITPVRPMII